MSFTHLLQWRRLFAATACVLGASMSANAGIPRTWTGGGASGSWYDANNWNPQPAPGVGPGNGDAIIYNAASTNTGIGQNFNAALTLSSITVSGSPAPVAITGVHLGLDNGAGGTVIDMSAAATNLAINTPLGLPNDAFVTINSARSLTVNGVIDAGLNKNLNVQGSGGTLNLNTDISPWVGGSQTVTTNMTAGTGTTVNFSTDQHLLSLTLNSATVVIAASNVPYDNKMLVTNTLTMTGASAINLKDNDLLLKSGSVNDVRLALKDGRIFTDSTYVSTNRGSSYPALVTAIGYAAGNDPAISYKNNLFDFPRHPQPGGVPPYTALSPQTGEPFDASSILLKYTYVGDANLDGAVEGSDFGRWAVNFSGGLPANWPTPYTWTQRNWNYDTGVDGADVSVGILNFTGALFYGPGGGGLGSVGEATGPGVSAVPEPATVGLLALGSILGLRRRVRVVESHHANPHPAME